MHHAKLHDVQSVVERARDHRQQSAGLFIERPEAEIVTIEVRAQGSHRLLEQISCRSISRRQKIVVDTPGSPDESIQNVRGRRDDVLLEPKNAFVVAERNSTIVRRFEKCDERTFGGCEIRIAPRFAMSSDKEGDSLALS